MRESPKEVAKVYIDCYGYEKAEAMIKQVLNVYRNDYKESEYWHNILMAWKDYK